MSGDDTTSLIWGVVMCVLLISSLAARKLPLSDVLKMSLSWVAIFAGIFALISFRAEFSMIWERIKSDIAGTSNQTLEGNELVLTRGDDGHFSMLTKVNGKNVKFLVDSGATITSMSSKAATEAGVDFSKSDFPIIISTANGNSKAWRGVIKDFDAAGIRMPNHSVLVSDTLGDTNLLGMNFLDQLSSWKVKKNKMVLTP